MGKFATEVQEYICDQLDTSQTGFTWQTEFDIVDTPIDIAGISDELLVLLELEWRRADPADNSAKIFRHLYAEQIHADQVLVVQVFTSYYDLARGGVSSKRKNAEFVGMVAADSIDHLTYYAVDFPLEPPKQGDDWAELWTEAADTATEQISQRVCAALEEPER